MKLSLLHESIPMRLDPAEIVDKKLLARQSGKPPVNAGSLPQRSGNQATPPAKPRHRQFFNTGPSGSTPENKVSNQITDHQSQRPRMTSLGKPGEDKFFNDSMGIK